EQYETGGWDDHWTIGEFSHAVRSGLSSAANEAGVADAVADRLIGRGRSASWGTTKLSVLGWLHGETWIAAGAAAEGMHTSQMLMIRALYAPGPLSNGPALPEVYNSRGECLTAPPLNLRSPTIDDIFNDPTILKGRTLAEVQSSLGTHEGWDMGTMRHSSRTSGWALREWNAMRTDYTDRMIQYHPGTPRHFNGNPYWKVSSGKTGTVRISAGQ
ncbi:MAG: hypothetical protein SXV54_11210, partial [Chloroflexota bacterium]|nr:hypothetical protein [Chloroflexota bacterium]